MSKAVTGMLLAAWPIGRLKPYPGNPRKITDADVEKLATAIEAQGRFADPIEVTADGTIVSGHRRYLAAKRLQLATVPVLVHEDMDVEEARAYRIRANRLSEDVAWDRQILSDEVIDLDSVGFDVSTLGMTSEELAKLFDLDRGHDEDDPEAEPEKLLPVVGAADRWRVGPVEVLVDEALGPDDAERIEKALQQIGKALKSPATRDGVTLADLKIERHSIGP